MDPSTLPGRVLAGVIAAVFAGGVGVGFLVGAAWPPRHPPQADLEEAATVAI